MRFSEIFTRKTGRSISDFDNISDICDEIEKVTNTRIKSTYPYKGIVTRRGSVYGIKGTENLQTLLFSPWNS